MIWFSMRRRTLQLGLQDASFCQLLHGFGLTNGRFFISRTPHPSLVSDTRPPTSLTVSADLAMGSFITSALRTTLPDDRYPPFSLPSTCMPENICSPMPVGFREAPTFLYCSSIHCWTNTFMEAVLRNAGNLWPTNFQFFYQYNPSGRNCSYVCGCGFRPTQVRISDLTYGNFSLKTTFSRLTTE